MAYSDAVLTRVPTCHNPSVFLAGEYDIQDHIDGTICVEDFKNKMAEHTEQNQKQNKTKKRKKTQKLCTWGGEVTSRPMCMP